MLLISRILTAAQSGYLLRVVVPALSYGGLFLLTFIVLGYAPRISTINTHDVLSRIVGNSTVTMSSLKWIFHRLLHRHKDPGTSFSLILAVTLLLAYGFFGTIADIGLMGLTTCSVAGGSYQDYPASVRSINDAWAIITNNALSGSDPNSIKSYLCDVAQDITTGTGNNITDSRCIVWHNSTYGDPTYFRSLNTTDTDVLMPKNIGSMNDAQGNVYVPLAMGNLVPEGLLHEGLAILPHDLGVQLLVGVPQLSNHQKVNIPKTLALEVEMGCMKLGIDGQMAATMASLQDFFTPDNMYNSSVRQYTGPDYLEEPLLNTAQTIRDFVLSASVLETGPDGLAQFNDTPGFQLTWATVAGMRYPWSPFVFTTYIMGNCTQDIYRSLNITTLLAALQQTDSEACAAYSMTGSFFNSQMVNRGHSWMVCATATQLNMVSALVEVDADGSLSANLTRMPSDLNIVQASFFSPLSHSTDDTSADPDPIIRFTLSDNPNGPLQHFIDQRQGDPSTSLHRGSGSIGHLLTTIGSTMVDASNLGEDFERLSIMDPNFFSSDGFHPAQVIKWGGSLGASYILGSVGYNAWAALDAQPLTIISTGGVAATCYHQRYGIALLPLLLAALVVSLWSIILLFSSRFGLARELGDVYGGLGPMMVIPEPGGQSAPDAILVWEKDPELHLELVMDGTPVEGNQEETLVEHLKRPSAWVDNTDED